MTNKKHCFKVITAITPNLQNTIMSNTNEQSISEKNWEILRSIHNTDSEIQKIERLAQIECEELEAYEQMNLQPAN